MNRGVKKQTARIQANGIYRTARRETGPLPDEILKKATSKKRELEKSKHDDIPELGKKIKIQFTYIFKKQDFRLK